MLRRWQCCGSEEVEVVSGRDGENDDCVDSVSSVSLPRLSLSAVCCPVVKWRAKVQLRAPVWRLSSVSVGDGAASFRCTEIAKGTVCKMAGITVLRVGTPDFSPLDPHDRVRRVSTSQSAFTWINELVIPFILIKLFVHLLKLHAG